MFHGQFFTPLVCYQVVDSLVLFFVGQGFPAVKHLAVPMFLGRFFWWCHFSLTLW